MLGEHEERRGKPAIGDVQVAKANASLCPRFIGKALFTYLLVDLVLIVSYRCFCGSTPDPKPPRLSTPHSCGKPCSRPRESGCGHPCPLSCHPGPCPPCQVTTRLTCYCPRKSIIAFRCGIEQGRGKDKNLSCGNVCGRTLTCGKHTCEKVCHEGGCDDCPVRETVHCWCGKSEKELGCGEGEVQECLVEGETLWVGRYACEQTCDRYVSAHLVTFILLTRCLLGNSIVAFILVKKAVILPRTNQHLALVHLQTLLIAPAASAQLRLRQTLTLQSTHFPLE
jgi:hypothetical protein